MKKFVIREKTQGYISASSGSAKSRWCAFTPNLDGAKLYYNMGTAKRELTNLASTAKHKQTSYYDLEIIPLYFTLDNPDQ